MDKKYNDFRDMSVWQKAFALLVKVYDVCKQFPPEERYALADDLRRAANSVVHNLAEGYGRFESKDKTRFYKIARGSSYEAMSQLLVADSQAYVNSKQSEELLNDYKQVVEEINALIYFLEK